MGKAEMTGAGHPGVWPDFRDLMSRTAREIALQEPDVWATGQMFGATGRMSGLQIRGWTRGTQFCGRKLMISGAKLWRFRGWKVGKSGGKLDPQVTKQIHGSNSTKHQQTNRSHKKFGGYFWWEFSKLGQNQQNKARKEGGRVSKFVINLALIQDDVG